MPLRMIAGSLGPWLTVRVPPQFIPTIGDDLFPGAPNPPALAQLRRQQAAHGQRNLVVRFR